MKIVFVLLLVVAAALVAYVILLAVRGNHPSFAQPVAAGVVPKNSIFHKPVGAACPKGTTLLPNYFMHKNGTTLDACYNPNGDGSIDYLNPGEGISLGVHLQGNTDGVR